MVASRRRRPAPESKGAAGDVGPLVSPAAYLAGWVYDEPPQAVFAASYSLRVAELEAIGITTSDLGASLRFYGLLGLRSRPRRGPRGGSGGGHPAPDVGHRGTDQTDRAGLAEPGWSADCARLPLQIPPMLMRLRARRQRRVRGQGGALGRVLGAALRISARPGRKHCRPVRAARIGLLRRPRRGPH